MERLEDGGAVLLGKLQMTESAYTSHHPQVAPPLDPWNTYYFLTGSGVVTSLGLCYGSLGSDTGGSIRFPSATCGLTGIKPTWGRVSRYGVFPLADTLDPCRADDAVRGRRSRHALRDRRHGQKRPHDARGDVPDYLESIGDGIRGLRIGIDRGYATDGVNGQVVEALVEAERVLGWRNI